MADLLSALGAQEKHVEKDLLAALIEGPQGNLWANLDLMFSQLEITVAYEYNDEWVELARSFVLHQLLAMHCESGRIGFWTYDDHIQLDTDERCGPLSGNPKVDTLQGFDIFHEMRNAYESALGACRIGDPAQFGVFGSSEKLEVNCERPIAEVPSSIVFRMAGKDDN